jgi:hypothetical protein
MARAGGASALAPEAKRGRSHALAAVAALALVLLASSSTACGPVLYSTAIDKAESALTQARERNAHWYAPYEYHFAQANLEKAYEEASHAEYEDAVRLAKSAQQYAARALRIAERERFEEP